MSDLIIVHPRFDAIWPWAADHFQQLWCRQGTPAFVRLADEDPATLAAGWQQAGAPTDVERLICLGVTASRADLQPLEALREAVFGGGDCDEEAQQLLATRNVIVYRQRSEGFWGQSVSEVGLALTLDALRRIPQLHRQIIDSQDPWDYSPPEGHGRPRARGQQYCDDDRFTSGTLAGKRVRVVGAGNIGSRYASFAHALGADVAVWDPFAAEPAFHRAGARREQHLESLVAEAEIFAPMLPLTDSTRGLVAARYIDALPTGCLVVTVTRAAICDTQALRRRVLADELALAADVFDVEPLPLDDPLVGRHNVVHTPHIAGRTADANRSWAEALAGQFLPKAAGLGTLSSAASPTQEEPDEQHSGRRLRPGPS